MSTAKTNSTTSTAANKPATALDINAIAAVCSAGHLGFAPGTPIPYEIFECAGNVYRAALDTTAFDVAGYRMGARWVCRADDFERMGETLLGGRVVQFLADLADAAVDPKSEQANGPKKGPRSTQSSGRASHGKPSKVTCYGRVVGHGWVQEWYETASRDARRRAAELRKLGYRVHVESMGMQVTQAGKVRMTLATITGYDVPAPARTVRGL